MVIRVRTYPYRRRNKTFWYEHIAYLDRRSKRSFSKAICIPFGSR